LGSGRAQVDALVERLGELHGLTDAEAQLARGFLLQGRGRERGRCVAALLALADRTDGEIGTLEVGDDPVRGGGVADLGLLAVDERQLRRKTCRTVGSLRELG